MYSHAQKLLFVRIPKNASTSLATFFIENCKPHDDDVHMAIIDSKIPMKNVPPEVIKKFSLNHEFIHLTLQQIVDNGVVSRNLVMDTDVYGVLRNPLERQVSLFLFLTRNNRPARTVDGFRDTFKDGCHPTDPSNRKLQTDFLTLDGVPMGKFLLYEKLTDHLDCIIKEKKIKIKKPLAKFKSQFRKRPMEELIDEYYDDATRDAVVSYYEADWIKYREMCNAD